MGALRQVINRFGGGAGAARGRGGARGGNARRGAPRRGGRGSTGAGVGAMAKRLLRRR